MAKNQSRSGKRMGRPPDEGPRVFTSLKIREQEFERMRKISRATRVSMSEIVSDALAAHLPTLDQVG